MKRNPWMISCAGETGQSGCDVTLQSAQQLYDFDDFQIITVTMIPC